MKHILISLAALAAMTGAALADGHAAKGEKVFNKCKACHSVADASNKVGPSLKGVVGRAVAIAEGYNYSDSLKEFAATGAVWDEANLDKYIADPKSIAPKGKMSFAGLKKEDERKDLIAFLKTKM